MLTVDEMTTDTFTFSISGTFDEDSGTGTGLPIDAGVLAIKHDWSNNFGVHTNFIFGTGADIISNTISVNGMLVDLFVGSDGAEHSSHDAIYFENPLEGASDSIAFTAGSVVSGSATLELVGGFDPILASGLELLSGYGMKYNGAGTVQPWSYDWMRLEATAQVMTPSTAVPVPSTLLLMIGAGLLLLVTGRAKSTVAPIPA
ncbi:hypothetical protein ACFL2V_01610 [Pseudomonadota bacterium]